MSKKREFIKLVTLISTLAFLFVLIVVNNISEQDIKNVASAFGMNTVVLPNPYSTLNQELIKKENDLKAKEVALQVKESQINSATTTDSKKDSLIVFLAVITIALLVVNLFLELKQTEDK